MDSPRSLPVFFSLLFVASAHAAITIMPADSAPLKFAATEIERAAKASGASEPNLTLRVEPGVAQAYRIKRDGAAVRVVGGDAIGAMYGGLDIAEAIRTGTLDSLKDSDKQPHILRRGIKFNIPLDLRTPSYSGHVNVTALTEKVAADLDIARNWKPGTLKDDGKRGGTEKGFRN
jgi:hypothetical protein